MRHGSLFRLAALRGSGGHGLGKRLKIGYAGEQTAAQRLLGARVILAG